MASLTNVVQQQVSGAFQQQRQQLLLSGGEAAQHMGLHCVRVRGASDSHPQPWHYLWGSRRGAGDFAEDCRDAWSPTTTHAVQRGKLTLEFRQLMQERTPLWPLQGIWKKQLNALVGWHPSTPPSPSEGQSTSTGC